MPTPKIEVLPIDQAATPDPQNVNRHTQRGGALLENSLRRRGAFRSIASAGKDTDTPVVYAGNYTLEKAVDAGFTEIVNVHVRGDQLVNVVRDDIAPGSPEAIALGLEDNESAKQSYNPDIDILAALAAGDNAILSALRQEDKTFGGMLERMGLQDETADAEPQFDRAEELRAKWGVETGDLWQIGEHRLICGDCTDAGVVARVMGGEKADVCFTDPPYGINKDGIENDQDLTAYFAASSLAYQYLKDDAYFATFGAVKFMGEMITRTDNYRFLWMAVNYTPNVGPHRIASFGFNVWSPLMIFVKGEPKPHKLNHDVFRNTDDTEIKKMLPFHTTPKNTGVCLYFIEMMLDQDGLLYEPFSGSGTTLLACENLGRHGRGIEISPGYVAVTLQRMADAFPGIEIRRLDTVEKQ